MIENQPNEITLIFHSDKEEDKKTRAYVETIDGFVVKTLDLKREGLTPTQLAEIADKLDGTIDDLIDAGYADQVNISSVKDLRDQDALKLLSQNPILIATPILIIGDHAFQFESSYAFIHESAAITGIKENPSANVEERET
jgi:arsenate reductase-like glutaredoxin family protein